MWVLPRQKSLLPKCINKMLAWWYVFFITAMQEAKLGK
jgi:hypothetical protein